MNDSPVQHAQERSWRQFLIEWALPPNPSADGTAKRQLDEVNALDVFPADLDFLVATARERIKHEDEALERTDRRGLASLTVSLTMLTAIFAGIGSNAIAPYAALPMFACVLMAILESLLTLCPITVSSRQTIKELIEKSSQPLSAQVDFLRNIHVVAATTAIGVAWRHRHFTTALRWLAIAAFASMIAFAFRPSPSASSDPSGSAPRPASAVAR